MELRRLSLRHQLKILRNIDSHMSHVETSNKVLTSSKHLNYWCWSFFLWLLLRRTVLIIDWPLEKSIDYWRSGEIQLCHYHRALLRCRSCRVRSQLERTGFYWKLWGRWIALFLAVQNSSIGDLVTHSVRVLFLLTLQIDLRDLWPLRHLIRQKIFRFLEDFEIFGRFLDFWKKFRFLEDF